jgi:SSS family solute:Na+ symporter
VARSLLAFMFIMSALLIHIGISLYAGAAVFQQFFGINVYASIVIISVVTAVYTVVGGLRAVVVTETIQAVILLAGAVVVTLLALFSLPEVGIDSFSALKEATREHQLSMLHTSNEEGYAWYAFLLGYPILGLWYWCTDQTIVQRVLGARTEDPAGADHPARPDGCPWHHRSRTAGRVDEHHRRCAQQHRHPGGQGHRQARPTRSFR